MQFARVGRLTIFSWRRWQLEAWLLPVRGGCIDGSNVDLCHWHHRLESPLCFTTIGTRGQVEQAPRRDLPGETPAVLASAAGALGASIPDDRIPLILIIVIFLIFGCLMDSLSMVVLAIPYFWPVVAGLGFGLGPEETKIWFGIIILVTVELGLITPPVGLNVFIINLLSPEVPMRETFKGVMTFFVSEILRISLLVAFPAIILLLPRLLG